MSNNIGVLNNTNNCFFYNTDCILEGSQSVRECILYVGMRRQPYSHLHDRYRAQSPTEKGVTSSAC